LKITDLNLDDFEYQTEQVLLLPYNGKFKDLFPPDLFHRLHARLIQDGTLWKVFPGFYECDNVDKWVQYVQKQPVVLYIVKPNEVVGFGWITEVQGVDGARKAAFGFWFVRKAWGTQLVRDICWFSLQWWFKELKIDVLYATSLRTNKLAINFSKNFGFEFLCHLPMFFGMGGRLVDATLICLKRDSFTPRFEFWRDNREVTKPVGIKPNGGLHLPAER
jgi:RimJ/RimL family protein N-acetyltransferase